MVDIHQILILELAEWAKSVGINVEYITSDKYNLLLYNGNYKYIIAINRDGRIVLQVLQVLGPTMVPLPPHIIDIGDPRSIERIQLILTQRS